MARLVLLVILHLALFLLYVASFLEMTSGMAFGRISHVARLHGCLRILRNAVRKNRTYTKGNRILDLPTASFCGTKWKQWRNQYGRVCRGDLLCSTRQRHGNENGGHGEQREVAGTAGLRKKERTNGHAAGADACVVKSTQKHHHTTTTTTHHTPPRTTHHHRTTTAPHTTHHTPDTTTTTTPHHDAPPPPPPGASFVQGWPPALEWRPAALVALAVDHGSRTRSGRRHR